MIYIVGVVVAVVVIFSAYIFVKYQDNMLYVIPTFIFYLVACVVFAILLVQEFGIYFIH